MKVFWNFVTLLFKLRHHFQYPMQILLPLNPRLEWNMEAMCKSYRSLEKIFFSKKRLKCIEFLFIACGAIIFNFTCQTGPEPGDRTEPLPIDQYDSAVVRSILDENGLTSVSVRSAGIFNERLLYFGLDSIKISHFVFTSDFNKLDSLHGIEMSGLGLDSISLSAELNFTNPVGISFDYNNFTKFPSEILSVNNIRVLQFLDNNIAELPIEIVEKNYQNFYIAKNRLCSVPDTIARWLSRYDQYWRNTQKCP
jgi:hypothetical protein